MNNPLISVIISTYNWSSALKIAIKTALWQTYNNIEVIVVGDACTDDSEEVVKSFNDARLKWYNLEKNTGSQAIPNNFGIEKANGEFIAHLGHDDVWHQEHLECLMKKSDNADFIHSICLTLGPEDEEGVFKNKKFFYGIGSFGNNHNKLLFVPPSSFMYRKSIVEKIGYWTHYEDSPTPPDADFLLKIWRNYKHRISCSGRLSVIKFPSAFRKNSYILKPIHDQIKYVKILQDDRNFLDRYLIKYLNIISESKLFKDYWQSHAELAYEALLKYFNQYPIDATEIIEDLNLPNGSSVKKSRIYRGLDKA